MFPGDYQNAAFIARRGSWNKSQKAGYDVLLARTTVLPLPLLGESTLTWITWVIVAFLGWLSRQTQHTQGATMTPPLTPSP